LTASTHVDLGIAATDVTKALVIAADRPKPRIALLRDFRCGAT
jgi:hypothetical protein